MTTKTTPSPHQLFNTMGLKSAFPSVFATASGGRSEETEEEDLRRHLSHHHHHHHRHHHNPLASTDELVTGPIPPVRPLRAQQQQQLHWATSSTNVTPGYVVSASSASVSSSQWSEFTASSSTVVQQTSHQVSVSTSSSHQFQTIRSQQVSTTPAAVGSAQQYLDDLKLPTQELDLAAQLGKSSMGRKGSLGGRRPPTIRNRKSSHGSLYYQVMDEGHPVVVPPINDDASVGQQTLHLAPVGSSSGNKVPPPRPPPPLFGYNNLQRLPPQQQPATAAAVHQSSSCSEAATVSTSSRSGTPPSLPANSPPPLPDPDDLLLEFGLLHSALPPKQKRAATLDRTDAVSMTETGVSAIEGSGPGGVGGGGIRRRTIVTLGSSGSINVTLVTSSSQPDLLFRSDPDSLRVERTAGPTAPVTVSASNSRASAFNVRRTIEQRRAQQQQQQQQQVKAEEEVTEEDQVTSSSSCSVPVTTAAAAAASIPIRTPPSSTYLYGEMGSPASSFLGSNRTMSISMSFDDLDTSMSSSVAGAGGDSVVRRDRGARKPEAWYERRQSYGFEAADKLQSLLNTSGSSDAMPSPSVVSRSCDSLSSTVRSSTASSQIEKMIPPWIIRNPSPGSTTSSLARMMRDQGSASPPPPPPAHDEDQEEGSDYEMDLNYSPEPEEQQVQQSNLISQSTVVTTEEPIAPTPTPSLQRSESSRSSSVQHLLTETPATEPIWLRDLKVRRSLRETRRRSSSPIQQTAAAATAAAPSDSSLDNIVSSTGETAPVWLKVKLRPTGVNLVDDDPASSSPTKTSYTPIFTVSNSAPSAPSCVSTSSDTTTTTTFKYSQVKKETIADEAVLNHHKSIELMRMLEETPLVNVLTLGSEAATEGSDVYSIGGDGWTECSSTIASVRNSNEDLSGTGGMGGGGSTSGSVRMISSTAIKVKKVAFGADVKEESDRKRSRPRRIRSRSPETRLRQWQEKLEEFKSSSSTTQQLQNHLDSQGEPEALVLGDGHNETISESLPIACGLPMTRFGDDSEPSSTGATTESSCTSSTFRSLLQARTPYVIGPQSLTVPESESVTSTTTATAATSSIINGIVNFDSSVERKIVILEESNQPPPKSILKKRSMENLLMDMPVRQLAMGNNNNNINERPRINVTMTNQLKEPHPAMMEQQVLPWRIHLKHVEHPPLLHPPPQPQAEVIPWKADLIQKKTTTTTAMITETNKTRGVPTAAEIIRNLRNPPVMMVARCEVKESTFTQPEDEEENNRKQEPIKADWGYHSLEQQQQQQRQTETAGGVKATALNNLINSRMGHRHTTTIIDESIARLNETIEEIRAVASPLPSADVGKRLSFHETSPRASLVNQRFLQQQQQQQSVDSTAKVAVRPMSNKRFSLGNEDVQLKPQVAVDESRQTYYQATSVVTHHHQSTTVSGLGRPLLPLPPPSPPPPAVAEIPLRRRSTGSPTRTPFALRADVVRPPPPQQQLKANSIVHLPTNNNKTMTISNGREERSKFVTASSRPNDGQRESTGMGVHTVVHHLNDQPSASTIAAAAAAAAAESSPGEESSDLESIEEVKVGKLVSRFESTASLSSTGSDAVRIKDKIKEMQASGKLQSKTTSIKSVMMQHQSSWSSVMGGSSSSSSSRIEKSIELTSGMAEDKAALLVRKFFGNDSVIEPKKSRLAQTETIMERDETTSETAVVTEEIEIAKDSDEEDDDDDENAVRVQCGDSSTDQAMTISASSSFGSLLDDDRSIRTASSATTLTGASILRYSSCSERSVRLSDIIDRPDPESSSSSSSSSSPSELSNLSASAVYTPPPPTRLIPSSRSNSRAETRSTTSASSTTTTTGSGSFRRNGSNNVRAQRNTVTSTKRPVAAKPPITRSSKSATAANSGSSSTRTARRVNATVRSATIRTEQQPPQPPPRMGSAGSIRAASAAWAKSLRTSAPTGSAAVRASARHPAAASVTKNSTLGETSTGGVKSSASNRTSSRLVTITSYSSRSGSAPRPEEAVSGIKVTPIAVGSGHYKIRMDQRLQASRLAASTKTASSTKPCANSQRPSTSGSKRPSRISQ